MSNFHYVSLQIEKSTETKSNNNLANTAALLNLFKSVKDDHKQKRKHDNVDEDVTSTTKGGSESSASEIRSASEEPMDVPSTAFSLNLWQQNRCADSNDKADVLEKVCFKKQSPIFSL